MSNDAIRPSMTDGHGTIDFHYKAVKVRNWKEWVNGGYGYKLHSGWALLNTKENRLVATKSGIPYMPIGGLNAVRSIVQSGLYRGGRTVALTGNALPMERAKTFEVCIQRKLQASGIDPSEKEKARAALAPCVMGSMLVHAFDALYA